MTAIAPDAVTPVVTVAAVVTMELPPSAEYPHRLAIWQWTPDGPHAAEVRVEERRPGLRGGSQRTRLYALERDGRDWLFLSLHNPDGAVYGARMTGGCTCPAHVAGKVQCVHSMVLAAAKDAGVIR